MIRILTLAAAAMLIAAPASTQSARVTVTGKPALEATVNYLSPKPEYTPPVLYNRDNRAKLVFAGATRFVTAPITAPGSTCANAQMRVRAPTFFVSQIACGCLKPVIAVPPRRRRSPLRQPRT